MPKHILAFFILTFFILHSTFSFSQTPAFPGADGGGKFTSGGRGGKVLYVTSLADDGTTGTLRWAITQTGARIIMFKVSGLITLKSALRISNGNVTIAGQTAPGDGICLKNYEFYVGADNVIIRYIRFRLGNEIIGNESDAIWGRYQKNIILDHCSMSWSIDECASFYSNENFTMQWCVIAESLNNAGHVKGAHGYGGIWGGKNVSYHHNLIAHHNSRNPRFNGWKRSGLSYSNPLDEERLDFRNNVVYNFGDNGSYGGEAAGKYNIVANYIKYGPATKSTIKYKVTQVDIDPSTAYGQSFGTYFIQDNYVYGSTTNTQNNWSGVTYASGVNTTLCKANLPFQNNAIAQHTAETAFLRVLNYSGASLARDFVDTRIVNETRNGTATYSGSVTLRPGIIKHAQSHSQALRKKKTKQQQQYGGQGVHRAHPQVHDQPPARPAPVHRRRAAPRARQRAQVRGSREALQDVRRQGGRRGLRLRLPHAVWRWQIDRLRPHLRQRRRREEV